MVDSVGDKLNKCDDNSSTCDEEDKKKDAIVEEMYLLSDELDDSTEDGSLDEVDFEEDDEDYDETDDSKEVSLSFLYYKTFTNFFLFPGIICSHNSQTYRL